MLTLSPQNRRPATPELTVIGAGLAGSEAAWQAASAGVPVTLYEMRPQRLTPAHRTGEFAELVCSNSLRAASIENAVGLLKEELRRLDSLIIGAALSCAVPAGGALAVDRERFAATVTERLEAHPLVRVSREEVQDLPAAGTVVVATGPLTTPGLAGAIRRFLGEDYLSFFDAAAPIVTADSVDREKVFRASRYGQGEGAEYLNCPMNEDEYRRFREALVGAELARRHDFEPRFFEGCLPVEELARRGPETLRFGPLKPVGLADPRTGARPYAVVQLRQDNAAATHYNLVGFQTSLRWPEQERVFRMIPGLAEARFVRYGMMHRNSFILSPVVLGPTLQARRDPRIFFAGQLTGVEGYVESAAMGLVAGVNAARLTRGLEPLVFPPETVIGALARYITTADPRHFQPMNAAFGLLPALEVAVRDRRRRNQRLAERALVKLASFAVQL